MKSEHNKGITSFVSYRIKRTLAFKALRKISSIVKQIENQDKNNHRNIYIAILLIIILAVFILSWLESYENRSPVQVVTSQTF